jgi:PAS domain S-box-containing protein
VLGLNPFFPFDITPIAFSISVMILLWGLYKLKSFSLVPVARDKIFHYIDNGVLIVDGNERIIDFNDAMQKILHAEPIQWIGQDIFGFFDTHDIRISRKDFHEKSKKEILMENGAKKYYNVSMIKIKKDKEAPAGSIIVFHDITKSKKAAQAVSEYNRKIIKLNHAARALSICKNNDEVFRKTAEHASKIIGFCHCSFFTLRNAKPANKYNSSSLIKKIAQSKDFYQVLAAFAAHKKTKTVIEDLSRAKGYSILKILLSESFLTVFYSPDKKIFTKENISICQLLLGHSQEALKSIAFLKELHDQAEKDSLTGAYKPALL